MRLGTVGALLAGLGVGAGAFGAHGLRDRLDPASMATFETAVRYQMIHGLAVLIAAQRSGHTPGPAARNAGIFFTAGIVLFSGSLYALALGAPRAVGVITPFGGLSFLVGWALLALSFAGAPQPH